MLRREPGNLRVLLCLQCDRLCCNQEVVTEEIFYVSDQKDGFNKPFQRVVPRSLIRVFIFRVIGWFALFGSLSMMLSPVKDNVEDVPVFSSYGSSAVHVLAAVATMASWGLICTIVYS